MAALQLANIDFSNGFCACRGTDGAFFLEAFNAENMMNFKDQAVNQHLYEQADSKIRSWTLTKEALAGDTTRPPNQNLSGILKNIDKVFEGTQAAITAADREVGESLAALAKAKEKLDNTNLPTEDPTADRTQESDQNELGRNL